MLFIVYVSRRNQINDASLARESFCSKHTKAIIYLVILQNADFFSLILEKETVEVKESEQRIGARVQSLHPERDTAIPLMRFSRFPLEMRY